VVLTFERDNSFGRQADVWKGRRGGVDEGELDGQAKGRLVG
jgi:hypothetical protein